jgi:DNA-directed RNA polymerase II subunit RPB2
MEWRVIEKYFRDNQSFIAKHHIDAYDHFVKVKLKDTIRNINPITIIKTDENGHTRHVINVFVGGRDGARISIAKPVLNEGDKVHPLHPNEARLRDLYYSADVMADVDIEIEAIGQPPVPAMHFQSVKIGNIPIMVNSSICILNKQPAHVRRAMGECPYDQGGYFIVDGLEKVIVSQERIVTNKLFITKPQDAIKHALEAQIQCTSLDDPFKKTFAIFISTKNAIHIKIPDIVGQEIPLFTMFRAMGVESDRQIISYIAADDDDVREFLYWSIIDNKGIYSQEAAYEHFKEHVRYKNIEHVKHIVVNDFLRNAGADMHKKSLFLGMLARRMIQTHMGVIPMINRDNYNHKRVDTAGALIFQLFRDYYNVFRKQIRTFIDMQYAGGVDMTKLVKDSDLQTCFDSRIIEAGIKTSLKGNWAGENNPDKAGIVQDMNRISYMGYLSHCRRLNTPMGRDIKLAQPRRLDASQWGLCCPVQSPDGASIGLDKHMSVLTYVSINADVKQMSSCLADLGCITASDMNAANTYTRVMLNNDLFVAHHDPSKLVERFRAMRQHGAINACCSITWNNKLNEVYVLIDEGRLIRPLFIVRDGRLVYDEAKHLQMSWQQLFNGSNQGRKFADPGYAKDVKYDASAPLEFLDIEEANNCLIAMFPNQLADGKAYTHCEIHPSTTLGLYTNSIPFAHHNQAPRNVFSGQQGKQAIGVYATNFNNRMDVMSYVLHYPQKPLVTTKYNKYTNTEILPNGENLMVAIACYSGFNQEDAVIINKQAIERGMFNVTCFKSYATSEEDGNGKKTMLCNPYELRRRGMDLTPRRANELTVDSNGMPKLNAHIEQGDCIIGRVGITSEGKDVRFSDKSLVADKTIAGIVDKNIVFTAENGERKVKIRMRKTRLPVLGDKMASRHGQKGVVGMIVDSQDMPFTKDGLIPDMIINPHAIPSRMTVGHLIECVAAKLAALDGSIIDGTVFIQHDVDAYYAGLERHTFERFGNEIMYNGMTGEQIHAEIFFGPTYYFRLKHMVDDKINYRSVGPTSATTHQPMRGRAIDGGLRLGEMERDVMLAHGATAFLKECYVDKSDGYKWMDDGKQRVVPYSFKLLTQELAALGIKTQL